MRTGTIKTVDATGTYHSTTLVRVADDGSVEYLVGDSAYRRDGWATLPANLHDEVEWDKIAIIGTGGIDTVIWGLGDTLESALADARNSDVDNVGWDSDGWESVSIGPEIVAKIDAGIVRTQDLGIVVQFDNAGRIKSARVSE